MEGSITTSGLQVTIPEYRQKVVEKAVTYFVVKVQRRDTKWEIDRRYKQFDELYNSLKKLYTNLPSLPAKTYFKLTTHEAIDKRRAELEEFLKALLNRKDVLSNEHFKEFLQLDSHAPEAVVNPAKLLLDMSSFSLGIRDFHYEDDKGLLFVGISDMNVASRVDSYLTNMKLPWEKDLKTTVVTVGAVECYLCTSKTELRFDRSWSRTFPSQLICIYWDQSSCSLGVGLDSGQIDVLKVSAELNYIKHNQVLSAKIHAARVMGIYIEYITGYLYSIGEDKRLKVTDIMKNEIVADVAVGNTALAVMVVEKETKRAFIGNRDGAVYIYDINPCPPRLIHSIQVTPKGSIRALDFDNAKNYLFACCYEDGNIFIHDLERPGKERFAKYLANLPGKQKVRFVKWTNSRNEIYACNDDGTVTVWNRGAPIYVLQSNADAVTKVQYVEGKNILLAGGKDRKLKFWQLPDQWRDKTVEEEEEKEAQIRKDTINMLNLQNRQAAKKGDDSDEDDLAGWHKMK